MAAELRRPQQGAYHAAGKVSAAAGTGSRGHSRGIVVKDSAAQPQRDMRRRHKLSARRAVYALSRLPYGRKHRREQIQRGAARGHAEGEGKDRKARQQDARDTRDTLRQDHHYAYRLDTQGHREGQDKGTQGGRQHGRTSGDTGAPGSRRVVRQGHRRPLRLLRLRDKHLAQLLRNRRQQAAVPDRERRAAPLYRPHHGPAAQGTRDTQA